MDDGSLDFRPKDHYNFAISTNAFSIVENELLVETLEANFGIKTAIHTPLCRGVRYPEIYIGAAGRERFFSLIKPFVLSCFRRRLPPFVDHKSSETEVFNRDGNSTIAIIRQART